VGRTIEWRIRVWSACAVHTARTRSWPTWTSLAISLLPRVDNGEAIQSSGTSWLIDAHFNCESSQIIQSHSEKIIWWAETFRKWVHLTDEKEFISRSWAFCSQNSYWLPSHNSGVFSPLDSIKLTSHMFSRGGAEGKPKQCHEYVSRFQGHPRILRLYIHFSEV
jgi:hypothetical protein